MNNPKNRVVCAHEGSSGRGGSSTCRKSYNRNNSHMRSNLIPYAHPANNGRCGVSHTNRWRPL